MIDFSRLGRRPAVWILFLGIVVSSGMPTLLLAEPTIVRQQELLHLLRHDCGSCHGMRLLGGLGAPLTPEVLSGKSKESLEQIILNGLPGLAMPPWKAILSQDDVSWLVERLLEGIPE